MQTPSLKLQLIKIKKFKNESIVPSKKINMLKMAMLIFKQLGMNKCMLLIKLPTSMLREIISKELEQVI